MKILTLFTLLLLATLQLNAQSYVVSPYSRYGLGEMLTSTEPVSFAMGGLTSAFRNRYSVNSFNPASYTIFTHDPDSLPMVFNGGFKGNYSSQKTLTQASSRFSGSLNSFSFGFKAAKNWGMAFGLQPYTSVGYMLESTTALDSMANYTAKYEGSGGFNKFWMGHAVELMDHLSLGVNVSYVFGSLTQTRRIVFDTSAYYNAKTISSRYVGDFAFDAGLQYELIIKHDSMARNNTRLILGASAGLPNELNARETMLAMRYYSSGGSEYIVDTTGVADEVEGTMSMPLFISGGFMIAKDNKWSVGADFKMQDWSGFTAFGESDSLKNSLSVNAGFSFTPDNSNQAKYYKRMTWYGGIHYDQTYLSLKGEELTKIGISFGCTFPLKSIYPRLQRSVISTGIEFGKMGTTNQNLIEEKYIRFVLGVSLKERWFEKKKYN